MRRFFTALSDYNGVKANNLKPHPYHRYLFDRLPMAETQEDYKKLLPQYLDLQEIR